MIGAVCCQITQGSKPCAAVPLVLANDIAVKTFPPKHGALRLHCLNIYYCGCVIIAIVMVLRADFTT